MQDNGILKNINISKKHNFASNIKYNNLSQMKHNYTERNF